MKICTYILTRIDKDTHILLFLTEILFKKLFILVFSIFTRGIVCHLQKYL
ncbi:hypothetical protein BACPU_04100 [Bacillus pumilus]|nr:hypothetical protein BACPU_04100 [Bacillus pumilus]